uniref:Uncharacterized conserved protein, DUF433 family n=1 Tax=Candidatus Kentrum sp. DK TaxID=2126562 RepID=A0A450SQJ0_9GAMM|nr:MAG: Uncharacterized conserved protein, DUF433 family [Candidatus Kentron sp. DK]VFJ58601.1 MAG: Uncharacterized conserved protein, DUF433 family [Candidatus Kentron sp. DK]
MTESIINVDSEIMGGTPVFRGTRVPIQTFIDHIENEEDMKEFFEGFPGVSREQAIRFLDEVKERILVVT